MVDRYASETFREKVTASAASYASLYSPKERTESIDQMYPSDLQAAFLAEFSISLNDYIEAFSELWDLAILNNSPVVRISRSELTERLMTNRKLSDAAVRSFYDSFGLLSRERWDQVPTGFDDKDFWPWRYQRRLSLIMRPLIFIGDNQHDDVLFGIQITGESMDYLLHQIKGGWLRQANITSSTMRNFIGRTSHTRGNEFTELVSLRLKELGWATRTESS